MCSIILEENLSYTETCPSPRWRDHTGSGLSFSPMLELSPPMACTATPSYLEQGSALRKKRSRGEPGSTRGQSLLATPSPPRGRAPRNSPVVILSFLGQPVTNPATCCSQVWGEHAKVQPVPSQLPVPSATTVLCGRKASGKKLVPGQKPVGHSTENRL